MKNKVWFNKQVTKKTVIFFAVVIISFFSIVMGYAMMQDYFSLKEKVRAQKKSAQLNEEKKKKYQEPVRLAQENDYERVIEKIKQFSQTLPHLQVVSFNSKDLQLGPYKKEGVHIEMLMTYKELLIFLQDLEINFPAFYWQDIHLKTIKYPEINVKLVFDFLSK